MICSSCSDLLWMRASPAFLSCASFAHAPSMRHELSRRDLDSFRLTPAQFWSPGLRRSLSQPFSVDGRALEGARRAWTCRRVFQDGPRSCGFYSSCVECVAELDGSTPVRVAALVRKGWLFCCSRACSAGTALRCERGMNSSARADHLGRGEKEETTARGAVPFGFSDWSVSNRQGRGLWRG